MKYIFVFVITCITLLSGCKSKLESSLSSCKLKKDYSVKYLGHAFGEGNIYFSSNDDNSSGIAYQITVQSPGSSEPDIAIKGIAQCLNGVVTGKFGAGSSSNPALSVLGGEFEGLFKHSYIDHPFGRWQVTLYDASKDKDYKLSGYWREETSTSLASH